MQKCLCFLAFLVAFRAFAQTWTLTTAPATNWTAIACSADGSKVVAAVGGRKYSLPQSPAGPIYTSTNCGFTWNPSSAPVTNWSVLASSADGSRLVAGAYAWQFFGPPIFLSGDFGATWSTTTEFPTN